MMCNLLPKIKPVLMSINCNVGKSLPAVEKKLAHFIVKYVKK